MNFILVCIVKLITITMSKNIPEPSLIRLSQMYNLLKEGENTSENISSSVIGRMLGIPSHTIRKDISYLGEVGNARAGYNIITLREFIGEKLMLCKKRIACVVGLGRIGSAIIDYEGFKKCGYKIAAGFDSNINLLETIKTEVSVYPVYQLEKIVREKMIELAFIAVPRKSALGVAEKLIAGGIKGIVNFSKTHISFKDKNVFVRNIDLVSELTILSAMISQKEISV